MRSHWTRVILQIYLFELEPLVPVQLVTILLCHKELLSSLPALLSDYHVMKAELDPPQYTKDWDTETPQVPWSLTPDSAAVSCLITSTSRLCWRYFSWPSGRCHASNMVLFIDTKPESHYICIWLLTFTLYSLSHLYVKSSPRQNTKKDGQVEGRLCDRILLWGRDGFRCRCSLSDIGVKMPPFYIWK